jgi:hypothetical protein
MGLEIEPDRRANLTGWSVAAALGLLGAAFLIECLVPGETGSGSERKSHRGASAVRLTAEGDNRGRLAGSPSEIAAKGWMLVLAFAAVMLVIGLPYVERAGRPFDANVSASAILTLANETGALRAHK